MYATGAQVVVDTFVVALMEQRGHGSQTLLVDLRL